MTTSALLVLAAVVAYVAGQNSQGNSKGNSQGNNQGQCSWSGTGTEPQDRGQKCAQMTKGTCTFLDQAIQCCPQECADKRDSTPGPQNQQQQNGRRGRRGRRRRRGCFYGKDVVKTKEYGTITLSELAQFRDAHVLTRNEDGELEYASVRYWLHAQPSASMKFVTLRTESGHQLSLSSEHLIYETECRGGPGRAIYARNVRVGRCLYVNENGRLQETRVAEKDEEKLSGIYSPITTTGSIVVNDVLASCYNYYENEALQKFAYQYLITFQDTLIDWLPRSIYEAAFNSQNEGVVAVPRLILTFLHLSKYFVH